MNQTIILNKMSNTKASEFIVSVESVDSEVLYLFTTFNFDALNNKESIYGSITIFKGENQYTSQSKILKSHKR